MEQIDQNPAVAVTRTNGQEAKSPLIGKLSRAGTENSEEGGQLKATKPPLSTNGSAWRSNHAVNGSMSRLGVSDFPQPSSPQETGSGHDTPPVRRSVQFSRSTTEVEAEEGDEPGKKQQPSSLLAKLRSLTTNPPGPLHVRTQSNMTADSHDDLGHPPPLLQTEDEADSERSDAEGPTRQRKKSKRPRVDGSQTAPTTPKGSGPRPSIFSTQSNMTGRLIRPSILPRRNTMPETQEENERIGVSEDEGRQRLASHSPRRRNRNTSTGRRLDSPEDARPGAFMRALTSFGATADGEPSPSWRTRATDRMTGSQSAAKIRNIIKMMRKTKIPPGIDQTKSAELLAELTAGVPAALMVASMFQRDQKGHRRIPVLLEQIKVKILHSGVDIKNDERHPQFRLQLEYGNGLSRMKWEITRSVRDFLTLYTKYKASGVAQKYLTLKTTNPNPNNPRFPHFPFSVFPYLRGIRGFDMSESEEERDITTPAAPTLDSTAQHAPSGPSGPTQPVQQPQPPHPTQGPPTRPSTKHRRHASTGFMRRNTSIGEGSPGFGTAITGNSQDPWAERQRRKLETWINQMIRYFMFRADSNRLCKFLELSALGIRLASEGSYHGKEGPLLIQSSKGVDFRKALSPTNTPQRVNFKWFLVRHSYIVCVESPEEMNIYDVFFIDSDFEILSKSNKAPIRERKAKDIAKSAKESATHPQHHKLKLKNSERKLRLFAKTERLMYQFEESIEHVLETSPWARKNRFDSFAPVRNNVFARFLVDGRDYMWNVSRAIEMAKDVIYIHDWWLSPEIYMRRPAAISQKYRLDRLLQRKAREGVKIYVIMYRNINSAIPIDSGYTKFSLLELDPNVFVQRSPNQIRQGTFFWAHHEKVCIVDHTIAFMGGIDLCFGRWDTPKHSVTDDKMTGFEGSDFPKDSDHCQLWPGKDYSNPRVADFYSLEKPFEEMYDRTKTPRMPWHDVAMQIVGQPARDLTRHFVQRWNYILRQRKPSRPTPFLLPPPDFEDVDLEALGIKGSCNVQILRSCGMWSMGTPDKTEHSIMNAYAKLIEESDHFIYIENQFFVSSCEWEGVKIQNKIGDALVERIIRAYHNEEEWRAVILIPLMPGFESTVDSQDGTSVRLIMQCQYRSICRGPTSIFGRLNAEGITATDYIQFYSLRSWGKIGSSKSIVTEQLYIHAKTMIVDDKTAIIGSANINERSMLGDRDSEVAAVVYDTDMIWSTMAGEPYQVGRFAHELRMRLMREHLGIDVDEIADNDYEEMINQEAVSDGEAEAETERIAMEEFPSFNHDADFHQADNPNLHTKKKRTADPRVTNNEQHRKDVEGEGFDRWKIEDESRGRERRATNSTVTSNGVSARTESQSQSVPVDDRVGTTRLPPATLPRFTSTQAELPLVSTLPELPRTDDTDIGGPGLYRMLTGNSTAVNPQLADLKRPEINKDCVKDPLNTHFYDNVWHSVAENNTQIYRTVFRCMPDNEVKSWKDYKEYTAYYERFAQSQGSGKAKDQRQNPGPNVSGPPGAGNAVTSLKMLGPIGEAAVDVEKAAEALSGKLHGRGSDDNERGVRKVEQWVDDAYRASNSSHGYGNEDAIDEKSAVESVADPPPSATSISENTGEKSTSRPHAGSNNLEAPSFTHSGVSTDKPVEKVVSSQAGSQKRRRRATTKSTRRDFRGSDDLLSSREAESALNMLQGHLVVFPYHWLEKEEQGGNWLYSVDQLAPLEIYN